MSKRGVIGLSATPGESAELALLDYIEKTRRPARSNLHHNNWYTVEAKRLTVDGYVNDFSRTLAENLAKYGAHLDAMVPDDGWQEKDNYTKIYQPSTKHEPLPELSAALKAMDVDLGIWLAFDGSSKNLDAGLKRGYRPAVPTEGYKPPRQWGGQKYFDILDPLYQKDLKEALSFLIKDSNVTYMKHDFNHCLTPHYLRPRHAREACLDVTLDLIAYERSLNPDVYINYTNGSTFSPFWLQFMECMWMQSGDSPSNSDWPQLSLREGATSYRDNHFYKSFNNPAVTRPVLPIANFMTHGILFSKNKPFTDFKDTLLDWSNYVVMYLGRGTLLKELYTSNTVFDDAHWEVLGKACAWAQQNQDRMLNTVLVGGDCAKGEVYGYVSWVDDRAVLVVRNPDRAEQTLTVPFDESVYFRGAKGTAYHARAIYPFVEQMPWALTSGKAMTVTVPGDSVLIYELETGLPVVKTALKPAPLPKATVDTSKSAWRLKVTVPDEELARYDLLLQTDKLASASISINGDPVAATRTSNGKEWTLATCDLRAYRGKTLTIIVEAGTFSLEGISEKARKGMNPGKAGSSVSMEAWLVADCPVEALAAPVDEVLPLTVGQNYRRQTQCLVSETSIKVK